MAIVFDYVMAVWLRLEVAAVPAEFDDELREYLLEAGFQVNELNVIDEDDVLDDDEDRGDDEVEVSLQIQLTLDESQMDGDEPTVEAVDEFDEELHTCLSSKYEVAYLDVMDDCPYSCLLGKHEDREPRKYPEPKERDLTESEKKELRARIQRGDDDIYALANEFACSASQVAGIKAALHR